jgi:hypothetical protein
MFIVEPPVLGGTVMEEFLPMKLRESAPWGLFAR